MADEPDNLVLVYLRRFDEKLDAVRLDIREIKPRLVVIEQQYGSISSRLNRLEDRLERLERGFDLVKAE
jgi:septation ring formation regulator EzrA